MNFKTISAIAAFSTILVACSNSPKTEDVAETTVEETKVEAVNYMAAADSKVNWKGEVAGVYGHEGFVNMKEGNLTMEGDMITGGTFVVDMTGIYPTDSASYKDVDGQRATDLAAHLATTDFFNTSEFPTSTFEITSVDGNTVKGNLTVRGKTNEETMDIESLEVSGDEVSMTGKMVFDRQKYDVAWVHFMKDMVLSDDITITYSLVAKK